MLPRVLQVELPALVRELVVVQWDEVGIAQAAEDPLSCQPPPDKLRAETPDAVASSWAESLVPDNDGVRQPAGGGEAQGPGHRRVGEEVCPHEVLDPGQHVGGDQPEPDTQPRKLVTTVLL